MLNKGGGATGLLPGLVTKQQAVEFPQVLSVYIIICMSVYTVPDPCLSLPCDVNALCEREGLLSPNFTCTCREPFNDGDGFNCSSKHPAFQ